MLPDLHTDLQLRPGTKRGQLQPSTLSAAKRSYPTSEVRGRSRKDPTPEGRQLRVPGCDGAGTAEVRGGGLEEQPHVQGAVAALVQEGLEELLHI